MTTDEKLLHFQENAMKEARERSNALLDEYRQNLHAIYEEHCREVTREAKLRVHIEKDRLAHERNKELSHEQLQIKHDLSTKQSEIKSLLFNEVSALLADYMKTSEYEALLVRQINAASKVAGRDVVTIYLSPEDADKKEHLEALTGMPLTMSDYSFIGGTRAVITARSILINNSFEDRLKDIRDNYQFGGVSHV